MPSPPEIVAGFAPPTKVIVSVLVACQATSTSFDGRREAARQMIVDRSVQSGSPAVESVAVSSRMRKNAATRSILT